MASTPGRKTSGELCHHGPWQAHTIRCCLPMLSSPTGIINGHTTSGVKCHHSHLDNTHGRTTSSADLIFSLGMNTRLEDIGHRIQSSQLHSINMVGRGRAWHAIIALGQHTISDNVMHAMQSSPLENTHSKTKSCVEWPHCPWASYMVELRRSWHSIIALK